MKKYLTALKANNYFYAKISIVDVRQGPKNEFKNVPLILFADEFECWTVGRLSESLQSMSKNLQREKPKVSLKTSFEIQIMKWNFLNFG